MTGRTVRPRFLLLFLGAALLAGHVFMRSAPPLVDEVAYHPQILSFARGDFTLSKYVVAIPGYFAVMALLSAATDFSSLASLRFLTLFISFGSIAAFSLLNRAVHGRDEPRRTLLYATLPIAAPFFFLLYTDILSLLLVFAAFACLLEGRHDLSGFLGTASLAVRQNNVVWLVFMMAIVYLGHAGFRPSLAGVREVLHRCWAHVWGVALFVLFVIVNKGVAVRDRDAHPAMHFTLGNLYFLLLVLFVLLLPLHIAHAKRILGLIGRKPWVAALLGGIFLLYMLTFENTHPYNLKYPDYFLRSMVLIAITSTPAAKAAAFLPIAWSLLSLCVTRLRRPVFYLLYPFTLLYLLPSWLIEQRYYLIPLSLFIAFREGDDPRWERATIALNLALAVGAVYVTGKNLYFL